MLCRIAYLQCEPPLPPSQATIPHPGSPTNCPPTVLPTAQRELPLRVVRRSSTRSTTRVSASTTHPLTRPVPRPAPACRAPPYPKLYAPAPGSTFCIVVPYPSASVSSVPSPLQHPVPR